MTAFTSIDFADTVLRGMDLRHSGDLAQLNKSVMTASASAPVLEANSLGHPGFEHLPVGHQRAASIATVFIDLSDFTGRSFWDDDRDVANLADSVLSAFVQTVLNFGGFPLGLRGDGLFAGFGPGDARIDCMMALTACAFALDAVETRLNPRLKNRGVEPVKARAGLDFGSITFIRSGNDQHSEVNPVGFAANFAAKCEKKAKSWEIVVGQGLAEVLPDYDFFDQHESSPKSFERNGQRKYYRYYEYRWRNTLKHIPGTIEELNGRPSTMIQIN